MGEPKLLMQLDGESLIRRCVRHAIDAGLDSVVVVLGSHRELLEHELAGSACSLVTNPEYERGINSSLRVGVASVPTDTIALAVMLPDMPLVTADMLAALVQRYRESDAPLVVSRYGQVRAPPMLYDRSLWEELEEPEGEGCGRHVVRRYLGDAAFMDWPTDALTDVDEPADYDAVVAKLGSP